MKKKPLSDFGLFDRKSYKSIMQKMQFQLRFKVSSGKATPEDIEELKEIESKLRRL